MEAPKEKHIEKENIKVGMILMYYASHSDHFFNGTELEVVRIYSAYGNQHVKLKISKFLNKSNTLKNLNATYTIGEEFDLVAEHLYPLPIPPKPHEYSPVFMTGRYRTVGD